MPPVFFTAAEIGSTLGPLIGAPGSADNKSAEPSSDSSTQDEQQTAFDSIEMSASPAPASRLSLEPAEGAAGALFKKDPIAELDSPDDSLT